MFVIWFYNLLAILFTIGWFALLRICVLIIYNTSLFWLLNIWLVRFVLLVWFCDLNLLVYCNLLCLRWFCLFIHIVVMVLRVIVVVDFGCGCWCLFVVVYLVVYLWVCLVFGVWLVCLDWFAFCWLNWFIY